MSFACAGSNTLFSSFACRIGMDPAADCVAPRVQGTRHWDLVITSGLGRPVSRRAAQPLYLLRFSSAAERALAALNAYFLSAMASARPSRRSIIACADSHLGRSLR